MDLKKRRLELGLTLKNIADIVGVGESTVRKWELGTISNMKIDKVEKLAIVLKTTTNDILGIKNRNNKNLDIILNKYLELEDLVNTDKDKENILKEILNTMEFIKFRISNKIQQQKGSC